jgi:hypothetical protein
MQTPSIAWDAPTRGLPGKSARSKEFQGISLVCNYYRPEGRERKSESLLRELNVGSAQETEPKWFVWLRTPERAKPEKQPFSYRLELTPYAALTRLRHFGQVYDRFCEILEILSNELRIKECLDPREDVVAWSGIRPQTRTTEYPAQFQAQLDFLRGLMDGWAGEDELAPDHATLDRMLEVVDRIQKLARTRLKHPIFPRLSPGFGGQVHLKYRLGHKRLFIEVYPPPDPRMAIMTTVIGLEGKTNRRSWFITSPEDLIPEIEWLTEPRD